MAGTTADRKVLSLPGSAEREALVQLNKLVTDLETIRAGLLGGVFASAAPGLAIGTSANTAIKITTAFTVNVNGKAVTVAAQEKAFTATTHDIADPDTDPREALYLLSTDTQGNVTITKGATAAAGAAVPGDVPAGEVVFGQVLIQHDGSAIFDATTNALNAAHLTVTYTDLVTVLAAANLTAAKISENGTEITA